VDVEPSVGLAPLEDGCGIGTAGGKEEFGGWVGGEEGGGRGRIGILEGCAEGGTVGGCTVEENQGVSVSVWRGGEDGVGCGEGGGAGRGACHVGIYISYYW